MDDTIRHFRYGLYSVIVIIFALTSAALAYGNFSDTEWASAYFTVSGVLFFIYRSCFRANLCQMRSFENAVRSVRDFHLAKHEDKIRQVMTDMVFFKDNDTGSVLLAAWYVSKIEDKKTLEALILELHRYRISNVVVNIFQKRLRSLIAGHDEEWIDSYLTDELLFEHGFPIDQDSIECFRRRVDELMTIYSHSQSARIINARAMHCIKEHPRESMTFDELWAIVDVHQSLNERSRQGIW